MTQSSVMKLDHSTLTGRFVRLEPLILAHKRQLLSACEADPAIWSLYPVNMTGHDFDAWWKGVEQRTAAGQALPYAILIDERVVGCSLFGLDLPNKIVEIGNTYLHPDVRGGPINPEAKRLMLDHAFEAGVNCVQFKVDGLNHRSRAAILKLGAKQDGVLRAARITWTGRVRDTVVFSILAEEWPEVRARLDARLATFEAPGPT